MTQKRVEIHRTVISQRYGISLEGPFSPDLFCYRWEIVVGLGRRFVVIGLGRNGATA